ncbi:MAG: hypothetical protein ACREOI_16945 [bacterium]
MPWRQNINLLCYPTPLFKAPADSVALDAFSAVGTLTRLGRRTSSAWQFGHRHSKAAVQCGQNVHSYEQIKARWSSASDLPHCSHALFISSATALLLSMTSRDGCYRSADFAHVNYVRAKFVIVA